VYVNGTLIEHIDNYNIDNFNIDNYNIDKYNIDNYNIDNYNIDNYNIDNYNIDNYNTLYNKLYMVVLTKQPNAPLKTLTLPLVFQWP